MKISLILRRILLPDTVLAAACLLLFAVGLAYLTYGTRFLFTAAGDFRLRWVEQQYVFRGKNPHDVFAWTQAESLGRPAPQIARDSSVDADLGAVERLPYPPWAYFTGAILTCLPTLEAGRYYFAFLNLALLAGLLICAYRLGCRSGKLAGLFFAASLFATSSICTTFMVGQYGVIVLAALVAACLLDERDHWFLGGLALGIAMTKVILAGPFAIPFLVKGRWKLLLIAGAYLVLGSVVVGLLVNTNPIEMTGQMIGSGEARAHREYGLISLLVHLGLDTRQAMKAAAVLSLSLAMLLVYLWRSASMLTHLAIAALAARAWYAHNLYDNLILIFLLLALGVTVWKTGSRLAIAAYIAMGLSLWLPGRLTGNFFYILFQWSAWVGCLAVLLFLERSSLSGSDVDGTRTNEKPVL